MAKKTPDREVVVPDFGRLLVKARGHRQPGSVVAKMHSHPEMEGFTRPQLDRYEKGQTPRPDPVALYFLAELYGADVREWLRALAIERERVAVLAEKRAAFESPPLETRAARRTRTGSR